MESHIQSWKDNSKEPVKVECNHDCQVNCKMLEVIIREESEMINFYGKLLTECDYADISSFIRELLEEKSRMVIRINQKLNELRVRGQVSDGIISCFEPDLS